MNEEKEGKTPKDNSGVGAGIGLVFGAGIGLVFGQAIFGEAGLGLVFGAGLGLAFGAAFGSNRSCKAP